MLDNKSRIFVNVQMRRYFGILPDSSTNKSSCWIGYPEDLKTPFLILLNQAVHDDIADLNRQAILENFNSVNMDFFKPIYSGYSLFREVEIKANRIQLNKNDRKLLCLPDDNRKIVIVGAVKYFHVWQFEEYEKINPEIAAFIDE